jgi:hypothetical protein
MIASVATALVPSAVGGGACWTICSPIEAWKSSQRPTEYLEGLKNAEADRKGTHFSFYYFNPLILLIDL